MTRIRTDIAAINPNPCTMEDLIANAQTQSVINNNQTIINQNGGGADTYKVAVDATDVGNATFGYLHVKVDQSATPTSPAAIPVRSETQAHLTELFAWSVQDVTGWVDEGLLVFAISDGVPSFTAIGADIDDKTVKCDAGDGTHDFLHAKLDLHASYFSDRDILVAAHTEGVDTSPKTERLFVKTDAIPGYNDSDLLLLGMEANVTKYFAIDSIAETYRLAHASVLIDSPSASTTVTVNSVVQLANGRPPTASGSDTLVATKWQNILNGVTVPYPSYKNGDHLLLISTRNGTGISTDWLVLPIAQKGADGISGAYTCSIDGEISAGSATSRTGGTGQIYGTDASDGSAVDLGNHIIKNPFQMTAKGDCTVEKVVTGMTDGEEDDTKDQYLIMGLREVVECSEHTLGNVVTNVECVDGDIVITTSPLAITVIDTVGGYGCS